MKGQQTLLDIKYYKKRKKVKISTGIRIKYEIKKKGKKERKKKGMQKMKGLHSKGIKEQTKEGLMAKKLGPIIIINLSKDSKRKAK